MLIECPTCRHSIRVVDLRPGRFTPRCPRCDRLFELTVSEANGSRTVVAALDASVFAEPVARVEVSPEKHEADAIEWPVLQREPSVSSLRPRRLPRGIPRWLGGHLVLKLLGHGPRGRVVLAQPLSLEPPRVLKLLAADRTADPVFLAQFTREAFAAAQIDHPNLVGIRELGSDRGHHFTAQVWIDGASATGLLESRQRLDPDQAAVVILQAARGLKAAHQQGLRHRDIKPANLLLDRTARIRVDDLGLEMTPSLAIAIEARQTPADPATKRDATSRVESVRPVAGTPAFMAPEQAVDPVKSDARADIYALGVTFYNLVTGKLPFAGDDAVELIRRHQEEMPIPPGEFVPNLPRKMSDIIRTMMGKRPEERYPNMSVVIDVLEGALGVQVETSAEIPDEAITTLRQAADTLARSPVRQLRFRILALSTAIWLGLVVLLAALKLGGPALGILGFGGATALVALIASGVLHQSELLRLTLAVLLGGGPRSWLLGLAIALAAIAALWSWGAFLPWFLILSSAGLVGSFLYFLDRPVAVERRRSIDEAMGILRNSRARGHDEAAIWALVARHGGDHWQGLFERVFGHHELMSFLDRRSKDSTARPRRLLQGWRDQLFELLESRLHDRRNRRHLRLLEIVEEKRLEARGLNLLSARRKARRIAKALIVTADQWREEQRLLDGNDRSPASHGPPLVERLNVAATQPEPVLEPHEPRASPLLRRVDSWTGIFLGRATRFVLASALLVLLATWMDAQGIVTANQVRDQAAEVYRVWRRSFKSADPSLLRELKWNIPWDWQRLAQPVASPWPDEILGKAPLGQNVLVAAVILLISLFSSRRVRGLLALAGSAVALFGPRWGLTISWLNDLLDADAQARALGFVIMILGWLWPRRKSS